jgi:hypothetical protein
MNVKVTYLNVMVYLFILTLSGCQSAEINEMVIESGGTGHYKAIILEEEILPGFTIYHPENMEVFSSTQQLPIVLWWNGDCQKGARGYDNFLNEIASYGYMVISADMYSSLFHSVESELTYKKGDSSRMLEALDWAIMENSRKSSRYYHKIDITKVAVAGQACGGLQVIETSIDPRVTTSIICNSGMMNASVFNGNADLPLTKETIKMLHAPILFITGDASDTAYKNADEELQFIDKVPVVIMQNQNTTFYETYEQPHGGSFAIATIAWLDWMLIGDTSMFDNLDCHCPYSIWKIEHRNFE